jgi:hypothetical protein
MNRRILILFFVALLPAFAEAQIEFAEPVPYADNTPEPLRSACNGARHNINYATFKGVHSDIDPTTTEGRETVRCLLSAINNTTFDRSVQFNNVMAMNHIDVIMRVLGEPSFDVFAEMADSQPKRISSDILSLLADRGHPEAWRRHFALMASKSNRSGRVEDARQHASAGTFQTVSRARHLRSQRAFAAHRRDTTDFLAEPRHHRRRTTRQRGVPRIPHEHAPRNATRIAFVLPLAKCVISSTAFNAARHAWRKPLLRVLNRLFLTRGLGPFVSRPGGRGRRYSPVEAERDPSAPAPMSRLSASSARRDVGGGRGGRGARHRGDRSFRADRRGKDPSLEKVGC